MKEIHLDQGSPDWLAWRLGNAFTDIFGVAHPALDGPRITATAASGCGGHSPFTTMIKLWQEMTGRRQREIEGEFAQSLMRRGNALEPKARQEYNKLMGHDYEALCVESSAHPWVAASLDGVDLLRTRGVEIKCPISERIHEMAMFGQVPIYYYDQIQWQMLSTDNQIKEIDFYSYAPHIGDASPITVHVDIQRQTELLAECERLRIAVITNVELCGTEFEQAARSYLVFSRRAKLLEVDVDAAKDRLKKIADGKSTQGAGVMVIVSNNDGKTNWQKVAKELAVKYNVADADLEMLAQAHKSKASTVTTVKEASDADAVYAEIIAAQTSVVSMEVEAEVIEQPTPTW
jgi:putative phage-type endonuclease